MRRKRVKMSRCYTYKCTSSLLIDVHVGEVTHNHLVTPPPAVHHHCIKSKCVFVLTLLQSVSNNQRLPAMRLLMVPDGTNSAASIWNISAAIFCNSAEIGQILQLTDAFYISFLKIH